MIKLISSSRSRAKLSQGLIKPGSDNAFSLKKCPGLGKYPTKNLWCLKPRLWWCIYYRLFPRTVFVERVSFFVSFDSNEKSSFVFMVSWTAFNLFEIPYLSEAGVDFAERIKSPAFFQNLYFKYAFNSKVLCPTINLKRCLLLIISRYFWLVN